MVALQAYFALLLAVATTGGSVGRHVRAVQSAGFSPALDHAGSASANNVDGGDGDAFDGGGRWQQQPPRGNTAAGRGRGGLEHARYVTLPPGRPVGVYKTQAAE